MNPILYKLTDEFGCTRGDTQWGVNITHKAAPGKPLLCSRTVIHAYKSPLLAVLLNPIHANIQAPIMWEASGEVAVSAWDKVGCKQLTTIKKVLLPEVTTTQKVAFAILCTKTAYKTAKFSLWADNWLSGLDRTYAAAAAARYAAAAAAARYAAADAAADAAAAARYAAAAARYAAAAARYAAARYAAAAADAARYAAAAAADAARYATDFNVELFAQQAMKY